MFSRSDLLGIDLVEIEKAQRFYRSHQDCLRSFFSVKETEYIRRGKTPSVNLAHVLAAKEAVFKAVRWPLAGPSLFRKIRIVPKNDGSFGCRVRMGRSRPRDLKISLIRSGKVVVAQCVGIS